MSDFANLLYILFNAIPVSLVPVVPISVTVNLNRNWQFMESNKRAAVSSYL